MYPLNYSVLSYYFLVSLQEIQPSLEELALDTYGRKVLMYLVGPRSPAHFHPNVVELFKKGDGNSIRYRQSHDCTNSDWIIQSGPRQVLHGELKKCSCCRDWKQLFDVSVQVSFVSGPAGAALGLACGISLEGECLFSCWIACGVVGVLCV